MGIAYFVNLLIVLAIITVQDGVSIDIKELECQFTDGLCDWSNDANSWVLGDYDDVSFGKPTQASFGGGYVYVGQDNVNHFHQLISPTIDEDVESFCFSFAYYMFGSSVGQLSLRLIDDNGSASQLIEIDDDVWKRKGSQDDDWFIGKYHFDSRNSKVKVNRIAFIATTPDIAIGPIRVNPGSCDYNDFCDFEDPSVCFWTIEPDSKSNFAWYISDGQSSENGLTQSDTTTRTESGKYLRTPDDGQKDSKSVLVTNVKMNFENAKCLSFNLFKPNQDSDLVEVSLLKDSQSEVKFIWTSSSIKADSKWLPVEVDLNEPDYFNIMITAHKHSGEGQTPVAIDDLRVDPRSCSNKIDCSFDNMNCHLTITAGPLLIGFGRLSNGQTLNYSMDTFKNNDPDDFFIYTDTPIEDASVKYQFESQIIPRTDVACLSFSYFIDSTDSKSIANYLFEIKVLTADGTSSNIEYEPAVIFGQWASVEYMLTNPYQIQFNLVAESKLFAGFDDIQLIEGACGSHSSVPTDEPTPNIYLREDFNDKTNWRQWTTWEIKKYADSKPENVRGYPLADPFGETTGHYISLYNSEGDNKQARIQSKQLDYGSYCLSIWFWCTSTDYSRLFVNLNNVETMKSTPVLDETCENQNHWKLLQASYAIDSDYLITLTAELSTGLIALEELTIFNGSCYQDHMIDETCTFDDGTDCGVDLVTSPFYNWRIEQGSAISKPMADKSTNTLNGKSLFLDLNPPSKIDSTSYFYLANLRREDSYCLSFAYYLKGECDLKIWKTKRGEIDSLPNPLVVYDGDFGPHWFQVLLQIDSVEKETDIVFGGSYETGSNGLIAIDDLKVSQGNCFSSGDCDFDGDCTWTNLPKGATLKVDDIDIEYQVTTTYRTGQAEEVKSLGYPRKDHTFGTSNHNYGYISNSNDRRAILASPLIYLGDNETFLCLTLAYAIDEDIIEILVEQQEDRAYVFKNLHSEGLRTWAEAKLTIKLRPSPSRMARVYIVSSTKGLTAVDDVSVRVGSCPADDKVFTCSDGTNIHDTFQCDYKNDCPNGEDELNCGSCEFTSDACKYGSSGTGVVWKVKNNFIELEQSRMTFGSETSGSIASPVIQETSSTCKINFSYAKHAADSFTVSLLTRDQIQIWDSSMVTETTGWNQVTIDLGRIKSSFQLVFKGTTTFRVFEYQPLSVDYVRFVDCDFRSTDSKDVFTCADGQRILTSKVCDSSFDCRQGEDEDNCNNQVYSFQDGLLSPWYNEVKGSSKHNWLVTSGNGIISDKPTLDHSRRSPTGQYVFLSWSSSNDGIIESTQLTGPELNSTRNCIITFYYYLSSPSLTINVYLVNSESQVFLKNVDQLSDFGFKRFTISLVTDTIKAPYKVAFTGFLDGSSLSSAFIALDDITFNSGCYGIEPVQPSPHPEPTPEPVPEKYCHEDEFYCTADTKCISIDSTCNYIDDCSDGEDEKYCGSCNFSGNELCGWTNEGSNQWLPMNRLSAQQEGFPNNTLDCPDNFLVATGSFNGGSSAIRSPLLGVTSSLCLFKFKYHLSRESKLTMRMKQENSVVSKVIEELIHSDHYSSADSGKWIQGQIELPSLTFDHYLQFVLDSPPSDTFLVASGLSDFNMLHCDPSKVNFDSFNCPFDQNSCGWTDAGSKGLSWTLTTNISLVDNPKFGFGSYSNRDHPTFINLFVSPDHNSNAVRTLTSPWQYGTDTFCFTFDYRMLAFDETKFSLIIETSGSILRTLFMKNGEPSYGWNHGSVTIKEVDQFRLIFRIDLGPNSADTVISIDNLALSPGQCDVNQASCDFTSGVCDWINKGWSFVERQQVPSADKQNREYYLRNYGDRTAILTLKGDGNKETEKCLSFWYFHTFNVTSDLQINSLEGDKITSSEVIPDHEMGNIWSYYRTSALLGDDYGIEIVAGPLGSFDTTAIDDVSIYNEPCRSPGNCDFEYDSCGWQSKNIVKWRRNLGVTPSTDNALGEKLNFDERGWFMFVRANDLNATRISTLESIRLTMKTPVCISFAYLFTSAGQSSDTKITVQVYDTHTEISNELHFLSDDGTVEWRSLMKTIRSINPFKVSLIASTGENESGDIALDDIKFTSGKCPGDVDPITTTVIPTTTVAMTTVKQEPTTQSIETTTINESANKDSIVTHSASLLTANAIMYILKQNSHIIVGTIVATIMLLFPVIFVIRRMVKPAKSYQPNQSIAINNKVYDIILGNVSSPTSSSIYEEVDSPDSTIQFEMQSIS